MRETGSARDEDTLRVSGIPSHITIFRISWLEMAKPKEIYQKVSLGLWQINLCTVLGIRFLQLSFRCERKTETNRERTLNTSIRYRHAHTSSHSLVAICWSMVIAAVALETRVFAHRVDPVGCMVGFVDTLLSWDSGPARTPAFCVRVVSDANADTERSVLASWTPCPA